VTQIAIALDKSRPTIYGWADKSLEALVHALRNIRTGRPPKAIKEQVTMRKRRMKDK